MAGAGISGATWSKEETTRLISLCGEEEVQVKLQECRKNRSIYEDVATEMKAAGCERSYVQCRDKIKKLKVEYKKVKDKKKKTGEETPKWEFFEDMDRILGDRPSTEPPLVHDSLADEVIMPEQTSSDVEEEERDADETSSTTTTSSAATTATSSAKMPMMSRRKRPKRRDSVVSDLLEQMITIQTKSEERMIDLEEKRMKMEERMLEKEAQQRREDREFQMQMMRMMMGPVQFPPFNQRYPSPSPVPSSDQSTSSPPFPFGSHDNYHYEFEPER